MFDRGSDLGVYLILLASRGGSALGRLLSENPGKAELSYLDWPVFCDLTSVVGVPVPAPHYSSRILLARCGVAIVVPMTARQGRTMAER